MPSGLAFSAPLPLSRSPRVVVVDDDRAVVSSLEFALGIEGYEVAAYYDAPSCLEGIGSCAAQKAITCLVVDFRLPGMNGVELLEELDRRGRLPPHMLMAGNPSRSCRTWANRAGVLLVEKPFLDGVLMDRIRWFCG